MLLCPACDASHRSSTHSLRPVGSALIEIFFILSAFLLHERFSLRVSALRVPPNMFSTQHDTARTEASPSMVVGWCAPNVFPLSFFACCQAGDRCPCPSRVRDLGKVELCTRAPIQSRNVAEGTQPRLTAMNSFRLPAHLIPTTLTSDRLIVVFDFPLLHRLPSRRIANMTKHFRSSHPRF